MTTPNRTQDQISLTDRLLGGFEPQKIIRRRHPWRLASAIVMVLLLAAFVRLAVTSPGFGWSVVFEYLFNPRILTGVVTTVWLTVVVMVIGVTLGLVLAVMHRSPNPLLRATAIAYIWIFRSVPALVQLLLWFNLALLFPRLTLGIPFTNIVFWSTDVNHFMTPILAAILGFGLAESAYMCEIMRSGLNAVDRGQQEAAWALGLTARTTFFRVTLPQMTRTVIPPTGNQVIGMLKYTSLASAISVTELLFSAQQISAVNFQVIPLLLVATAWYIVLASILQLCQGRIERRFSRGAAVGQHRAGLRLSKSWGKA